MGAIRSKLTYANVAATLAVVIACSSGAYAVGLAKNSVKSSHIKNGQVKTADIKNNTVTGKDVNESKLARVPDAAKLAGVPASRYASTSPAPAQGFFEGTNLRLEVPGYGDYELRCDDLNNATTTDDLVNYSYVNALGVDARSEGYYSLGPALNDASYVIVAAPAFAAENFDGADAISFEHVIRAADGGKAIRITGIGWDDTATTGCAGRIETRILR